MNIKYGKFELFCRKQLFEIFGINLSFVATRSGLTRWEEYASEEEVVEEEGEEEEKKDEQNVLYYKVL